MISPPLFLASWAENTEVRVLKKLSLAGLVKLSWLRFVWPQPTIMDSESTIGRCSNGKTSIVCYRTLSFFSLRLKKKRKFVFFVFLNTKSLSNLFTSLWYSNSSIFKFFNINMFASLRKFFFYYGTFSLR